MVGSAMCQCTEVLGWGYESSYWLLPELFFAEELSVGCAYRLGGLGIAMIVVRLSCDELWSRDAYGGDMMSPARVSYILA